MTIELIATATEYCRPCGTVLDRNLYCTHCSAYPRVEDIRVHYNCVTCKAELRDSSICPQCKTEHRWS